MDSSGKIGRRSAIGSLGVAGIASIASGFGVQKPRSRTATLTPLPIPAPNPNNLQWPQVSAYLASLYTSKCAQSYPCYFYLNTLRWIPFYDSAGAKIREGFEDAAGEAIANPGVYKFHRQSDPLACVLQVEYMPTLAGQPAFSNGQPKKNLPAVFVSLDNFGCFVPFETAALISACFQKGLVSRLILGSYQPIWSQYAPNKKLPVGFNDISTATITPNTAVDSWISSQINAFATTLNTAGTWSSGSDFDTCLSAVTNCSIQVAGILLGWRAGDAIVAATDPVDQAATLKAFWGMLGWRFTAKEIGRMMGYALMMLSGFLENDRTFAVTQFNGGALPTTGATDIPTIYNQMSSLIQTNRTANLQLNVRQLVERFFALVEGEFYGITQNPNYAGGDATKTQTALVTYSAFMSGFVHGMASSADRLFSDFYNDGYNAGYQAGLQVGYTNGFRDGYSQGLAAGYTVGYGAGDAAGYANGASAMGGLGTLFTGINNVLGSASGILSDAGTVGTVIGTIASLF
jgi:hypothetical protein